MKARSARVAHGPIDGQPGSPAVFGSDAYASPDSRVRDGGTAHSPGEPRRAARHLQPHPPTSRSGSLPDVGVGSASASTPAALPGPGCSRVLRRRGLGPETLIDSFSVESTIVPGLGAAMAGLRFWRWRKDVQQFSSTHWSGHPAPARTDDQHTGALHPSAGGSVLTRHRHRGRDTWRAVTDKPRHLLSWPFSTHPRSADGMSCCC